MKLGVEVVDMVVKDVVGELGMFGCIVVDNIYNILVKEDLIVYLLNGMVDLVYVVSLKMVYVLSLKMGWFKGVGDVFRGVVGVGGLLLLESEVGGVGGGME